MLFQSCQVRVTVLVTQVCAAVLVKPGMCYCFSHARHLLLFYSRQACVTVLITPSMCYCFSHGRHMLLFLTKRCFSKHGYTRPLDLPDTFSGSASVLHSRNNKKIHKDDLNKYLMLLKRSIGTGRLCRVRMILA